ncbi:efflux RND transporter periplasmic adaptor subunit [Pirellulaceae bacterium SH449]
MNKLLSRLTLMTSLACFAGCTSKEVFSPAADAGANSLDRVTAGPPTKKTLQLFTEQPGRVVAFEETPILSKLPGYVESVECDIGDMVTKGQVLVRIHAPEYKDQLEQKRGLLGQAEAQVKQAEAALVAAEAALNSSGAMVVQAEAGLGRADAEYARWDSELKRIQQLVSKGSVTTKLADETTSQFQSAEATRKESLAFIESAKAREREADANVLTAKADIDAAKAKLKVSQSDIAQAETMLTYMELTAPFDGFVTSRNVDAGHYVQPAGASNAKPLMTVSNVNKVRVFVSVPESEAAWVDAGFGNTDAGDLVTILSPFLPGGKIEARVTRTSLQLDPLSRSLSVEIDLDNNDLKLLPGAFVTTKILLEQRENVLTLPIGAIIKAADGTKCCVVVDGKIEHRPIELGLRAGDDVEIKSGLEGSERIVLVRAGSLQAGQSVEIIIKK